MSYIKIQKMRASNVKHGLLYEPYLVGNMFPIHSVEFESESNKYLYMSQKPISLKNNADVVVAYSGNARPFKVLALGDVERCEVSEPGIIEYAVLAVLLLSISGYVLFYINETGIFELLFVGVLPVIGGAILVLKLLRVVYAYKRIKRALRS